MVSNAVGKDSLIRTSWITVLPSTTGYYASESEGFENATFPISSQPEKTWGIISTVATTWKRTTTAHVGGGASVMISNSTSLDGSNHQLHSPVFELAPGSLSPKVSFKYAFARRTTSDNDRLVVYYSTNCGRTWFTAFSKTGAGLATRSTTVSGTFTPTSAVWRQENATLSLLGANTKFRLKFEFTSGGGNNLYLDDIQISTVTGVSNLQDEELALNVVPNPSSEMPFLEIFSANASPARLQVTDQIGRQVLLSQNINLQTGSNLFNLSSMLDRPKPGTYYVKLQLRNRVMVRQWVLVP